MLGSSGCGHYDRYCACGVEPVTVRLIGEDGSVFAVIGRVLGALRDAGLKEAADEFRDRASSAGTYDEVMVLVTEYCEVC